jgi:aminopeptidase N
MRRALLLLAACGGNDPLPDALPPTANTAREVIDTKLAIDLAGMTGVATITFGASTTPGASLEINGLTIDGVTQNGADLPFKAGPVGTKELDLALPASDQQLAVAISYHWMDHEGFMGVSAKGFTLDWPYYCSNIFPCHSQPSDGTTFALDLQGVPAGKMAVFPATIDNDAPAYQLAWAIDGFTQSDLGTTTNGTAISVWSRTAVANEITYALAGTAHLVAAFDWFEQTLGPYRFGNHYGSVSVGWPAGAFGGMEHHPFVHIGASAIGDEETNVHEAAHGWFGDGIRIQCWEDFVLSEGTVSYLAARALDVVAPAVGANVWAAYTTQLGGISGSQPVWPQTCGKVDVIKDNLFTQAPYMRGAFFYKGIADKVGASLVDQALRTFYQAHAGGAATMQDMLDTIKTVTGYDPTACAQIWLLDMTQTPTPGPCP